MIRSPRIDSDFFRLRNPPPPVAPQNVEWCCIWDSVQSVEQPCTAIRVALFGSPKTVAVIRTHFGAIVLPWSSALSLRSGHKRFNATIFNYIYAGYAGN